MSKKKYSAFISYRSTDKKLANLIFQRLERWRTPRNLLNQEGRFGLIPSKLGEICLDREDFPTSEYIETLIAKKIANSEKLIVVCTPNSAEPDSWVNREITLFRELRPNGEIHAIIGYGEPPTCFPKELLLDQVNMNLPLAADMRPEGDGRDRAIVKLIAGLIGVDFSTLWRRNQRRRIRNIVVGSIGTIIISTGLYFFSNKQIIRTKEQLSPQSQQANFQTFYEDYIKSVIDNQDVSFTKDNYKILLSDNLNNDGRLDYLVYNQHHFFCGSSGCSMEAYESSGNTYKAIGTIAFSSNIRALSERIEGYKTIVVQKWNNQMREPLYHRYTYKNGEYRLNEYLYCGRLFFEYCDEPIRFSYIDYNKASSYEFSPDIIWFDVPHDIDEKPPSQDTQWAPSVVGFNSKRGLYIIAGEVLSDDFFGYKYAFVYEKHVIRSND